MVRTWSGRYNPGLEWTMPGAWPQNIVNTLIQAQHDVEKGHTRWKHSKLREALEKDFPSDGSKRSPEANERLKRLHYQEQAEYKKFLQNRANESVEPLSKSQTLEQSKVKLGGNLKFSRPLSNIPPDHTGYYQPGKSSNIPPDKVEVLEGRPHPINLKAEDPQHLKMLEEKGLVEEGTNKILSEAITKSTKVRPIPSNLRWNEGLGRYEGPGGKNFGQLMDENLKLRRSPKQSEQQLPINKVKTEPSIEPVGWESAVGLGSQSLTPFSNIPMNEIVQSASKLNLTDPSMFQTIPGMNPVASSIPTGQTAAAFSNLGNAAGQGAQAGAQAAGASAASKALQSWGVSAFLKILNHVANQGSSKIWNPPIYNRGIGQGDSWESSFLA